MWRHYWLQESSDSLVELGVCCHHALVGPMKSDCHSDDKSTFWRHVLTRDHLFVMILVYLRYSTLLMMGQGGATGNMARMIM
jgi:hypothetical protein